MSSNADSRIMNCWGAAKTTKLDAEEQVVHRGTPQWGYHHHSHCLSLEGRLYLSFSSGRQNEDDVGQRVLLMKSEDVGKTWSAPRPAVVPPRGHLAEAVCTANGLHGFKRADGTAVLVLYYGQYEYTETGLAEGHRQRKKEDCHHANTRCMAMFSEDGVTFDRHFVVGDRPNRPPRLPGMHKGGAYGYPYMVVEQNTAVVACSISKEDMAVSRFNLPT